MAVYQATMETVYYTDKPASSDVPCELKIDGDDIVVSINYPTYISVYTGKKLSEGHYRLECKDANSVATLHCFDKGKIFEGYWYVKEDQDNDAGRGFWRIYI